MGIATEVINKQNKPEMLRRALERIIQLYTDKSHLAFSNEFPHSSIMRYQKPYFSQFF